MREGVEYISSHQDIKRNTTNSKTAQGNDAVPKPNSTTTYDFVITYIVRVRALQSKSFPGILRNIEKEKRKKS